MYVCLRCDVCVCLRCVSCMCEMWCVCERVWGDEDMIYV